MSDVADPLAAAAPAAKPPREEVYRHTRIVRVTHWINALCLWCSLAWVATITMFWYVTSFNVRHDFLPAPGRLKRFLGEFTWVLPVTHVGIIGMLILTRWGANLWA